VARKKVTRQDPACELAVAAARIAHERHCENVVVLDLRGKSPVTNYFVIATGTSARLMRSVAEEICEFGAERGQSVWRQAGMDSSVWIVLDFVYVVVHLFDSEHRAYYDLELIWGDTPHVTWEQPGSKADEPAKNT
jgi:ribosome-associated protein